MKYGVYTKEKTKKESQKSEFILQLWDNNLEILKMRFNFLSKIGKEVCIMDENKKILEKNY